MNSTQQRDQYADAPASRRPSAIALILCAVALRIENEQIAATDNIGQVRLRYTGNGDDGGIGGIPVAVWLLLKIGEAFSMRSVFILYRPRFRAHQCKAAPFGQLQDMPPKGSR
ncbi:MAG: hypothetical protein H0X34_14420 [Chthoniobacterales bacterium]|nr:hypothetical protein [Chthoniobacterales bacterium]